MSEYDDIRQDLSALQRMRGLAKRYLLKAEANKYQCKAEIARLQCEWEALNAREFHCGTCPACGQTFPPDRYHASMDSFEKWKKARLDWLVRLSESYKNQLRDCETVIRSRQEEVDSLSREIAELEEKMEAVAKEVQP